MARSRRDDDEDDTPRKKPRRPVDDDDDDDEPIRPAAKKKPAKPLDDDEDEDDAPPPKKRPAVKASARKAVEDDDEDDADEDDDDTPRKKPKFKSKKKGGLPKPLLIGGVIAALLLFCGCGGLGIFYVVPKLTDSPKAAVEDFVSAAEKGDGGRMWDRMDNKTQANLTSLLESSAKFSPDAGKYKDKKGRDLFIAMTADKKGFMQDGKMSPFGTSGKPTVESYTTSGDTGSVVVRMTDGKTQTVQCVKEDGRWRLQSSR